MGGGGTHGGKIVNTLLAELCVDPDKRGARLVQLVERVAFRFRHCNFFFPPAVFKKRQNKSSNVFRPRAPSAATKDEKMPTRAETEVTRSFYQVAAA